MLECIRMSNNDDYKRAFYLRGLAVSRVREWGITHLRIQIHLSIASVGEVWTLIHKECPYLTSLDVRIYPETSDLHWIETIAVRTAYFDVLWPCY
jgi:hypothetical protein